MKRGEIRFNILVLALLGTAVVLILPGLFPAAIEGPVIATLAGALIGWFASITKELMAPPPDPEVPASIVEAFMERLVGNTASEAAVAGGVEFRINVLALVLLGALLIFGLAVLLKGVIDVTVICALAGTLLGAIGNAIKDLVGPPPNPAVPASVVHMIGERLGTPGADAKST